MPKEKDTYLVSFMRVSGGLLVTLEVAWQAVAAMINWYTIRDRIQPIISQFISI